MSRPRRQGDFRSRIHPAMSHQTATPISNAVNKPYLAPSAKISVMLNAATSVLRVISRRRPTPTIGPTMTTSNGLMSSCGETFDAAKCRSTTAAPKIGG